MTRRAPTRLILALGALLWPLAGGAQPEPAPAGRSDAMLLACEHNLSCAGHLALAGKFYAQENYSAAINEYQAAYQLYPYRLILFNIGRIYHKQKNYEAAIDYYRRYLDTGDPSRAARAGELLEQAKQERATGAAAPGGQPATASANQAGNPTPNPAPPATALNRLPAAEPLTGAMAQPPTEYEPPPAPLLVSLPTAAVASEGAARADRGTALGARPLYRKWWFWTAVGGAAAGVAAGVAVGLALREPSVAGLPADTLIFQR